MIRRCNCGFNNHSSSYLSEYTRRELILKSIKQSPERVVRSQDPIYKRLGKMQIDVDGLLYKDNIVVTIPIKDYLCVVEFRNVIETIAKVADTQEKGNVNFKTVEKALNQAIDSEKDLRVNCSCPDFYYRFSYVADKNGYYQTGKRQLIPAPITNPNDDKGSFCKHLIAILKNKDWVRKLASIVNYLIKEYYLDIINQYDFDPNNFYINLPGQKNPKNVERGPAKPEPSEEEEPEDEIIDDEDLDDEEPMLNIT